MNPLKKIKVLNSFFEQKRIKKLLWANAPKTDTRKNPKEYIKFYIFVDAAKSSKQVHRIKFDDITAEMDNKEFTDFRTRVKFNNNLQFEFQFKSDILLFSQLLKELHNSI